MPSGNLLYTGKEVKDALIAAYLAGVKIFKEKMFKRKYITLLILGIFVFLFSGCSSVIEYMNRPDEVHERISNEYEEHMKKIQELKWVTDCGEFSR